MSRTRQHVGTFGKAALETGESMKIVVIAHRNEKKAPDDFQPFFDIEARTVLSFMVEDFIREAYSRQDGKGAVFVVEASSLNDALTRFAELPFMQNDLLTLEAYPVQAYRAIADAAKPISSLKTNSK